MHLNELVEKQIRADKNRGFLTDLHTNAERYEQLSKDLLGLLGEIGEFANVVKKVGLKLDHSKYDGPSLSEATSHLREELADSLIYIMRLSFILNADLEREVLNKMNINDARYRSLDAK